MTSNRQTDSLRPLPQCRTPLPSRSRFINEYVALVIGYKNAELVKGVLTQLSYQNHLPRRVIIVDNGGTFAQSDRQKWPLADRSALISRPDNPGYGAAVNLARTELKGSALLVLTHDAQFAPNLAELLLEQLQDDTVGSVGPLLYFANNRDRVFSAGGKLSSAGRASHIAKPISHSPYSVDWVDGAIVMFSSRALDAIGWLDESYFLYFEDVDTCWRLSRAGFKNLVAPSAVACQQPGAHPPYLGMRNMALFAHKAGISRPRHLCAVIPRLTRETLSRLRRGLKPELGAAVRGLRDGYANVAGPIQTEQNA